MDLREQYKIKKTKAVHDLFKNSQSESITADEEAGVYTNIIILVVVILTIVLGEEKTLFTKKRWPFETTFPWNSAVHWMNRKLLLT